MGLAGVATYVPYELYAESWAKCIRTGRLRMCGIRQLLVYASWAVDEAVMTRSLMHDQGALGAVIELYPQYAACIGCIVVEICFACGKSVIYYQRL